MRTEATNEIFEELMKAKSKLSATDLKALSSLINRATEEVAWMSSALSEIAELTGHLMTPADKSPIDVIKRLIIENAKGVNHANKKESA
jgi:hypothetical protein